MSDQNAKNELTPLVALEIIKAIFGELGENWEYMTVKEAYPTEINVIETALKENEELKQELVEWKARFSNDYIGKMVEAKVGAEYKQLKAFEIIKEKRVDVRLLLKSNDLQHYNNVAEFMGYEKLTQEEYDLLKEVLL